MFFSRIVFNKISYILKVLILVKIYETLLINNDDNIMADEYKVFGFDGFWWAST